MNIVIHDHRPRPLRARWTRDAVSYYPVDAPSTGRQTEPRHHAGGAMSLAEIDAWLVRGELARGHDTATRVTYSWHRTDDAIWHYRAVVVVWGRWDVARSWHYDAHHPRELFHELVRRGVLKCACDDDAAYLTWLTVGRAAA